MVRPFLSIVIPTRSRAETLASSLRACCEQTSNNYEIIVADNASSPETKEVVDKFANEKVRYIRSDEPLPMHENWNRGLAVATGEYVTVIGDDDGLIPSAVSAIEKTASRTNAEVIAWPLAQYFWRGNGLEVTGNEDLLVFPTLPPDSLEETSIVRGRALLKHFAATGRGIAQLPMIYCAAVHRGVIQKVTAKGTPFFRSLAPDIYSGMLLAHLVDRFVRLRLPVGVRGTSRYSTYSEYRKKVGAQGQVMEFLKIADGGPVRWHPEVPQIPVGAAAHYESFYTLAEQYSDIKRAYAINLSHMYESMYRELQAADLTDEQVAFSLAALRDSASRVLGDKKVELWEQRVRDHESSTPAHCFGIHENYVCARASSLGVTTVDQACSFIEAILGARGFSEVRPGKWKSIVKSVVPPVLKPGLRFIYDRLASF